MTKNISGLGNNGNLTYSLTEAQIADLMKTNKGKEAQIKAAAIDGFNPAELIGLGTDIAAQIIKVGTIVESPNNPAADGAIDKAKTAALQKEIKTVQDEYKSLIDKETGLRDKLNKVNSEFETSRSELNKAVDEMTGAAANASVSVNADVNKILAAAKNGKMDKATAQSRLAGINVPSLNGEKLSLSILSSQVEGLSGKIESLSSVYQDVSKAVGDLATKYGSFLEADLATICVNTSGKIVINQAGAGGPAKTGADGIAALDVAKFASMTTEDLAKELDGNYKELYESIKGAGDRPLTSTDAANVIKGLIATQNQKGDPSTFGTFGAGADVNILNGINKDDLAAAAKKAQTKKCDPYEITIDGKTYEFIKENGDGKFDTADIFGINDTKDKLFESMKTADMDKNGKITGEELAKMGIRMVQKEGGKLQTNNPAKDFDLKKIDSIDLKSLKSSNQNNGEVGTFGNFDMKLKDGRSIEGKQTFEELSTLQKLFNGIGNFFAKLTDSVVNKFKLDPQTTEFYSKLGKFSSEMSKMDIQSTNQSIDITDMTLDASKESISYAKNLDVGKNPNEAPQKTEQKPVEQKVENQEVKKKKPEEPQL